jgi:hypothetical protein
MICGESLRNASRRCCSRRKTLDVANSSAGYWRATGKINGTLKPREIIRMAKNMNLFKVSIAIVLFAALLGSSLRTRAYPAYLRQAAKFGAKNCTFCHTQAIGGEGWNDRGNWLIKEKERRTADAIDVAWLAEYKEGEKKDVVADDKANKDEKSETAAKDATAAKDEKAEKDEKAVTDEKADKGEKAEKDEKGHHDEHKSDPDHSGKKEDDKTKKEEVKTGDAKGEEHHHDAEHKHEEAKKDEAKKEDLKKKEPSKNESTNKGSSNKGPGKQEPEKKDKPNQ